jgi:hypothetical protein
MQIPPRTPPYAPIVPPPRPARSALEERIFKELARQWSILNRDRFKGSLKTPFLNTWSALGRPGLWRRDGRVICLDGTFTQTQPWGLVLDELARQMVHQYVDEVRGLTSEPAHTAAYLRECDQRGLGSGIGRREVLSEEAQRALRRVMQLLALAESPNRHESEAAMQEAQRLMLKYNLEVAPHVPRPGAEYETRLLGRHRDRTTLAERYLSVTLRDHFFVRTFWRWLYDPRNEKKGWVLEVSGTPTNLEMAAYVYDFLIRAGARLWREHRRQKGIRGERGQSAYLAGVMQGFQVKLQEQQKLNQAEGLVWLGDKGLEDFDARRYPDRSFFKTRNMPWDETRRQGFRDGKQIVLHLPLTERRPAGPQPPRDGPRPSLPAGE